MRRRSLALIVPVLVTSFASPAIAAAGGSSAIAGSKSTVTSSPSKGLKSPVSAKPTGRRWN